MSSSLREAHDHQELVQPVLQVLIRAGPYGAPKLSLSSGIVCTTRTSCQEPLLRSQVPRMPQSTGCIVTLHVRSGNHSR